MTKRRAETIDPRDLGLRTFALKQPLFDAGALQRADKTLEALGDSMGEWLEADLATVQRTRVAAQADGWSTASLETLAGAAHDLKGMAATYGYPLVTQIAASLCRLIETDAGKAAAQRQPELVCAHVDAARAAVRDGIKTDSSAVGRTLLRELERRVALLGVAPR